MKTNLQQSFSVVVDVHCIYNVYVFATRTISTQLPPLHSAHSVMLLFRRNSKFYIWEQAFADVGINTKLR